MLTALAACLALCAAAPPFGGTAEAENAIAGAMPRVRYSASMSTGLPWDGRLKRAARLQASKTVRHLPRHARRGHHFGTAELVGLIERSARTVARRFPGSRLTVGELSARRGGWIKGHHSHRNGRDVDLAFFMMNGDGEPERYRRFVAFGRPGTALRAPRRLRFDDTRNWALVSALMRDPEARVQYVFVAKPIRTRLLMEARRRGESNESLRAAAAVLVEPRQGNKHADHFHVRIFCSRDDRPDCMDGMPYWPWYDGTPPDGQYATLPKIKWRTPKSTR